MYNKNDFTKTVLRLADNNESAPPKDNVIRSKHFYQDNSAAILRHIRNMVNTYGREQFIRIIEDLRDTEDL